MPLTCGDAIREPLHSGGASAVSRVGESGCTPSPLHTKNRLFTDCLPVGPRAARASSRRPIAPACREVTVLGRRSTAAQGLFGWHGQRIRAPGGAPPSCCRRRRRMPSLGTWGSTNSSNRQWPAPRLALFETSPARILSGAYLCIPVSRVSCEQVRHWPDQPSQHRARCLQVADRTSICPGGDRRMPGQSPATRWRCRP